MEYHLWKIDPTLLSSQEYTTNQLIAQKTSMKGFNEIINEYVYIQSENVEKLFNFMLRSYELKGRFTGATWVVTGAFVTVAIFPKEIAILALLFMGLGDTVAGLIGSHFGRIKIWNKTLEGTLAGLAICFLITGFFPGISIWIRISGAVSAMLAELSPIPLDDNIMIPMVSGTIMVVMSTLVT